MSTSHNLVISIKRFSQCFPVEREKQKVFSCLAGKYLSIIIFYSFWRKE
jgi:hypothetical protein